MKKILYKQLERVTDLSTNRYYSTNQHPTLFETIDGLGQRL